MNDFLFNCGVYVDFHFCLSSSLLIGRFIRITNVCYPLVTLLSFLSAGCWCCFKGFAGLGWAVRVSLTLGFFLGFCCSFITGVSSKMFYVAFRL